MRQQINLYQPVLSVQRTPLSASTATLLLGTVCVALCLWWLYAQRQVANLENEVQSARVQQQRQETLARALGAAQVSRSKPIDLQARVRQLDMQLTERRRILGLLRGGELGTTDGFADRLAALARQRIEGVWLDQIVLSGASGVATLAGRATDPNLVPRYLQALATEQDLKGTRFNEFQMGQPSDAGPVSAPALTGAENPQNDSKESPKPTIRAMRFRASSVAPPPTQAGSSS